MYAGSQLAICRRTPSDTGEGCGSFATKYPINVSSRLPDSKQLVAGTDDATIANYSSAPFVLGNAWTPALAPAASAATISVIGSIRLISRPVTAGTTSRKAKARRYLRAGLAGGRAWAAAVRGTRKKPHPFCISVGVLLF